MGASADDVSTLSPLGKMVQAMGATADALPPEMVWTYRGFWPRRILRRRRPLQTRRSPAEQEGLKAGKPDSPKCQTRPSNFPEDSSRS
jgi:hypothetical protein